MSYKIVIEEIVSQEFYIDGTCAADAVERAKKMYAEGALVLDNPEVTQRNIACCTEDCNTDWEEF